MSFQVINTVTPSGQDKKKFGDDIIREFKGQVAANLSEISTYPSTSKTALRTAVWTTATRPTGDALVDRVMGYNTDLGYEEYYDAASTTWKQMSVSFGVTTLPIITTDLNSVVKNGVYWITDVASNRPTDWGVLTVFSPGNNDTFQRFECVTLGHTYTRKKQNGAWSEWLQLVYFTNSAQKTIDGTVTTATTAKNIPVGDVGGNIWIA